MVIQHKQIKINDTRVLLSIKAENWGLGSLIDWSHSTWNVYYDGIVEYANFYSLFGKVGSNRWQMDKESLLQLKNILENDFQKEKTHRDAMDGTGYCFTSFDENGITLHSTGTGYIYGNECLEGIMELLQKPSNE